jgi:flagellar basal-body rod modification protein FlgD
METTAVTSSPPRPSLPEPEPRTSALSSDFETFLRMLTVQMKNQDPLNPIESSDFAVQLATFSGVEQQVRTNDLLGKLADGMAASGLTEFAGWIGKDVRTAAAARFDGAPLVLYPGEEPSAVQTGFLVVRDAAGLPVARSPMPLGDAPLAWAGVRSDGTPFPPGLYRFEVELVENGSVVRTVPVEHYARVTEVRADSAGPVLMLSGDVAVTASEVKAVREGRG